MLAQLRDGARPVDLLVHVDVCCIGLSAVFQPTGLACAGQLVVFSGFAKLWPRGGEPGLSFKNFERDMWLLCWSHKL